MKKIVCLLLSLAMTVGLVSCKKEKEEKNQEFDYSLYEGLWEVDYSSYKELEHSDYIYLDITANNPEMLRLQFENEYNLILDEVLLVSEIKNNKATIPFVDTWGVSGKFIVTFNEDSIECEIKDVVASEDGFDTQEASYTLYKSDYDYENENVYEDDYEYEDLGDPVYDTSKASGILAQLGMTEEEFKNSCFNINNYNTNKQYDITYDDLLKYPNDYIGMAITDFHPGDNFIIATIEIDNKNVSTDGYIYYTDSSYSGDKLIFDYRDDVYYPTLSVNEFIVPYMIFSGVQTINGTDYLCFQLIAVDVGDDIPLPDVKFAG